MRTVGDPDGALEFAPALPLVAFELHAVIVTAIAATAATAAAMRCLDIAAPSDWCGET
jgi:hypothetical protein